MNKKFKKNIKGKQQLNQKLHKMPTSSVHAWSSQVTGEITDLPFLQHIFVIQLVAYTNAHHK
ncbi:hypothetical protein Hanom_Chr16g01522901 [Helianthus anomalus]